MFDAGFATTLKKFGWTTEIQNVNPHLAFKYAHGIYHFVQVSTQSHLFTQRAEQGCILIHQENLEEDKSCRKRKNTDLYHFGLMQSCKEILKWLLPISICLQNIW